MSNLTSIEVLQEANGFKLLNLNIRSPTKKIDQLRLMLHGGNLDVFTDSETWLESHILERLVEVKAFNLIRLDSDLVGKPKIRKGGLITYVHEQHASSCESVKDLNSSNEFIEAQWIMIHRLHCKNIVVCHAYRPPKGGLKKHSLLEQLPEIL